MRISRNDKDFIVKALQEDIRIDGRNPFDSRKVAIQFGQGNDSATVTMGSTRVASIVVPVLDTPFPDRPNEGVLRFNVEFSPMASPDFEGGRPSESAIEMIRLLEHVLRNSRAVDREALCVLAGHKVWHLDISVTILDHAGNLTDACLLSAVAALMVFRRPEVEVAAGDGATGSARTIVLSPAVREPLPLSLHQLPLSATFAVFGESQSTVMDPTFKEEAAASGVVTVIVDTNSDICAIRKTSGVGIPIAQVHRLTQLASSRAGEVMQDLKQGLQQHEASRVSARVRRHASAPQQQLGALPRSITALPMADITDAVQHIRHPNHESDSGADSSSVEDDMGEAHPVSVMEDVPQTSGAADEDRGTADLLDIPQGAPASAAPADAKRAAGARQGDRSAAPKRTAVGIQKQQPGFQDFFEGDSDLDEDLLHIRKALQTKDRRRQL